MPATFPKLPRPLEQDPRAETIRGSLCRDLRPLWEKGDLRAPHLSFTPRLATALRAARDFRQLQVGMESIEQRLAVEKKGLDAVQKKQGTAPAQRISRLLLLASDGAERFYRSAESAWRFNSDRLLVVRLDCTSDEIGSALFGPERAVKALLVFDKDGVSQVLSALAGTASP